MAKDKPTPAPVEVPALTDEQVDKWFIEHIHGSILAQNTEAYNLLYEAKEKLKNMLKGVQ